MQVRTAAKIMAIAVGIRALTAFVKTLLERFKNSTSAYDGLDSVVSFSSRMIAASRAVEANEDHPLVADPLAASLAGTRALERSLSRAKDAPPGGLRKKLIGPMAIRTRWFDDQILAALGVAVSSAVPAALLVPQPAAPEEAQQGEQREQQQEQQEEQPLAGQESAGGTYVVGSPGRGVAAEAPAPPRQVVLLGAGMDSRPWRLALPEGVSWFEVDRSDVLQAKKQHLQACSTQLSRGGVGEDEQSGRAQPAAALGEGEEAPLAQREGSNGAPAPYAHPLRAASWAGVPCDLSSPGWAEELRAAGWNPSLPTVWVAEGLLMYLTQQEVEGLLREMAGASAPGSVLVAMSVTQAVIEDIQRKGAASELLGTWKFGCPPEPREFLAQHGWRQEHLITRRQMAARLRLDPALCGFKLDEDGGDAARSVFLVASMAGEEDS